MKLPLRVLLFLVGLVLFVALLAVLALYAPLPLLGGFVAGLAGAYGWLHLALEISLVVCLVLCGAFLLFVCVAPSSRSFLILPKERGSIEISKQSIQSLVGATLREYDAVRNCHVQIKGSPKRNRLRLNVDLEMEDGPLAVTGEEIRSRVEEDIQACLSVQPKRIRVRIYPYLPPAPGRAAGAEPVARVE